jgi:hypothetical protein
MRQVTDGCRVILSTHDRRHYAVDSKTGQVGRAAGGSAISAARPARGAQNAQIWTAGVVIGIDAVVAAVGLAVVVVCGVLVANRVAVGTDVPYFTRSIIGQGGCIRRCGQSSCRE